MWIEECVCIAIEIEIVVAIIRRLWYRSDCGGCSQVRSRSGCRIILLVVRSLSGLGIPSSFRLIGCCLLLLLPLLLKEEIREILTDRLRIISK